MTEELNQTRSAELPGQGSLPGTIRPHLNRAEEVAAKEAEARAAAVRYADPTPPDIILSLDIETLALCNRPVITEIGLLGYDLDEDSLLDERHIHNYPIEPQQSLIPPRKIETQTLMYRVKSPRFARELELSSAPEFEDLASLCRNFITVFNQLTNHGKANYELVVARPQFDINAVETLLREVGLDSPWRYDTVVDVRTMLKRAGSNPKNVPLPVGCVPHTAYGDARWQIDQYKAAIRG